MRFYVKLIIQKLDLNCMKINFLKISLISCRGSQALLCDMQIIYSTVNNEEEKAFSANRQFSKTTI